jgi:arachidonate 15-lipoxygenase
MQQLKWKLKSSFWNWFIVLKFKSNKPRHAPRPTDSSRKIGRIPLCQRYPSIPISDILVADHVPTEETERFKLFVCAVQAKVLYRYFPPKVAGLPPIGPDPMAALDAAYTPAHRKSLPAPVIPAEYQRPIDLGWLAVAGPYFCYLRRAPEGGYEWDLRSLDHYEYHPGLRRLGVRVNFEVIEGTRRLRAVAIDCELGRCTPEDPTWEMAQQLALCAATTHLSLVRHFNGLHLAMVSPFAIATRNMLHANHCLRRLLWPHVWGSHYSNELVTEVLMTKGGDFEEIFSFTHAGLCKLFTDAYNNYDIRAIDPLLDAEHRGVRKGELDLPALENREAHWNVIHAHARRYLDLYYTCDQDLRDDTSAQAWVDELNHLIPNGIDNVTDGKLTIEGTARLIADYIYAGTVEHEVLGTGLWNYQLWTHVQPIRIYKNGQREPIDLYQRLVNYNYMLNVSRAPLLQDLSYMAGSDDAGAAAFSTFLAELAALQARLRTEEHACWKISPDILEVGVNG